MNMWFEHISQSISFPSRGGMEIESHVTSKWIERIRTDVVGHIWNGEYVREEWMWSVIDVERGRIKMSDLYKYCNGK